MDQIQRKPSQSLTEGFVLCTPSGTLLGHTYRQTADEAVAAIFSAGAIGAELWAEKQGEGWTVEHVFARIFTPKFYVDVIPQEKAGA